MNNIVINVLKQINKQTNKQANNQTNTHSIPNFPGQGMKSLARNSPWKYITLSMLLNRPKKQQQLRDRRDIHGAWYTTICLPHTQIVTCILVASN